VTWWVVYDGPELVAFAGACLMDKGRALQLVRAGVDERARGKGLQRRLIGVRERWGRRMKARQSVAYTATWNTRSANNLIRMGYTLYHPRKRRCGYGADKRDYIYFRRPL
jgi:hypothetical protein